MQTRCLAALIPKLPRYGCQVKLRKCDEELKPESLTVLEETPRSWILLVLSDGMCDGGALEFDLAR